MELNNRQKEAVEYNGGPLMITAGAGTGKTRVIIHKIAYLINTKNVASENIAGLTFSNKAAEEMKSRLNEHLKHPNSSVHISTFHSFCDSIVRQYGYLAGIPTHYKLLDDIRQKIELRKLFSRLKPKHFLESYDPLSTIMGLRTFISRAKDELVLPHELYKYAQKFSSEINSSTENSESENSNLLQYSKQLEECACIYTEYEKILAEKGYLDYGDQIIKAYNLLKSNTDVLKQLQKRHTHIVVDEYQDTNSAQIEIISLLAQNHKNLCVVGDDDQAIYRFRGASYASFKRFRTLFPGCKEIMLDINYRSTRNILTCAGLSIQHNRKSRLYPDKKITTTGENGIPVQYVESGSPPEEAERIADLLNERYKNGNRTHSETTAVLYRAHTHGKLLYKACRHRGIPCTIATGDPLLYLTENKFLVSMLHLLNNTADDKYLYSIFEHPFWQLSTTDMMTLLSELQELGCPPQGIIHLERPESILSEAGSVTVRKFQTFLKPLINNTGSITAAKTLQKIISHAYNTVLMTGRSARDNPFILKEIISLYNFVLEQEENNEDKSLGEFIEFLDYFILAGGETERPETSAFEEGAVNFLTVHAAKGLEFDTVFLISLQSRKFPTTKRRDMVPFPLTLMKEKIPEGDFHLQEERRLFYVAMTRTRQKLYLSAISKHGSPCSLFVNELLKDPRSESIIRNISERAGNGEAHSKINSDRISGPIHNNHLGDFMAVTKDTIKETIKRSIDLHVQSHNAIPDPIIIRSALLELSETEFHPANLPTPRLQDSDNAQRKLLQLDYSKIDTYTQCPLKYKFRYMDKIRAPKSARPTFGQTIHDTLQRFYQIIIDGEKPDEKTLFNLYETCWRPDGYKDPAEEARFRNKGEKQLKNFFKWNKSHLRPPKSVEEYFQIILDETLVAGKIDRIDIHESGAFEIIDYKTGKQKSQKDADTNLQVSIYAEAVKQKYGSIPENLTFYYLETNEAITTQRSDQQLSNAFDTIRETASLIREEKFEPIEGNHCKFCDYPWICPKKQPIG